MSGDDRKDRAAFPDGEHPQGRLTETASGPGAPAGAPGRTSHRSATFGWRPPSRAARMTDRLTFLSYRPRRVREADAGRAGELERCGAAVDACGSTHPGDARRAGPSSAAPDPAAAAGGRLACRRGGAGGADAVRG